jgi:hypothetical protein
MGFRRRIYFDRRKSGSFAGFARLGDTLIYNDFELNVSITAKNAKTVLA